MVEVHPVDAGDHDEGNAHRAHDGEPLGDLAQAIGHLREIAVKRAAEQIVVELRDKVGLIATDSAEDIVSRGGINAQDEATQALISLGYSELDAMLALKNVDPNLKTEDRIKQALKGG